MMHDANTEYDHNGSVERKTPAIHNKDGASTKYWKKSLQLNVVDLEFNTAFNKANNAEAG